MDMKGDFMGKPLLSVKNLSIEYEGASERTLAVDDVSFSLNRGECLGIIGESGSGKTSIAMAIMGILPSSAHVKGSIMYDDVNIQCLSEGERNMYRWGEIAVVFQNSLDVLNPVLTVHEQIYECIIEHTSLYKGEADRRVENLLELVGLDPQVSEHYPHHLSGGMRQKVLIAMALSCNPKILIVDEPTSSLDPWAKDEIIHLLKELQRQNNFAMIVISHEIHIISQLADRLQVMYSGCIMERGYTEDILQTPMHSYTRGFINSSPYINPYKDLWGIPSEAYSSSIRKGCPFYNRCYQRLELCSEKKPELSYVATEREIACNRGGIITILEAQDIDKTYEFNGNEILACKGCNIHIRSGETVVLMGESGSGKTTLATIISGVLEADSGQVQFLGKRVEGNNFTSQMGGIQIVFQDPFSSINEFLTVEEAIVEPLTITGIVEKDSRRHMVKLALKDVQLPYDDGFLARRCYTLSGGQRQRVALARSLIMQPKLLIADEVCSMLDPSTQANILRLLKGLQNAKGFSMLYITHDVAIAQKIADRLYVMHEGNISEENLLDIR